VDAFGDYLADLDAFVAKVREDGVAGKLFAVAHSQGGLVASLWALGHPGALDGYVLTSPYFRLALKPPLVKVLGAKLMGRVIPWLPVKTGLDVVDLTSDPEMQRWTDRDPLYGRATTPRWFDEANRAQTEVLHRAAEFQDPLLVLAAGADRIADASASRAFVDAARSADKRLVVYEGFRHEIFNERERERPVTEAVAWLAAHVS
jgi:lysophospholipase